MCPLRVAVGAVPVLSRDPASGKKGHFSQVKTPHNPLDSSAPLMKKGKQREVPKAKKPTSLKKVQGGHLKLGAGKPRTLLCVCYVFRPLAFYVWMWTPLACAL